MKPIAALAVVSVGLFGCGKSASNDKAPTAAIDRLMQEDGPKKLKLCELTWDESLAEFEKRFGKPVKEEPKETYTTFTWAIVDGDRCAYFTANRGECPVEWGKPGPRYSASGAPVMTTKAGPNAYRSFDECVALSRGSSAAAPPK